MPPPVIATTSPTAPGTSRPHCYPAAPGKAGRPAQDNRRFSNAVFRVLRTSAPWLDLPSGYGDGCATHRRFLRWRQKGVWAQLLEALIDARDLEWLMIDASHKAASVSF